MSTTVDYNAQATEFLEKFGLRFSDAYVGLECPPFCAPGKQSCNLLPCKGVHGGHYQITISRGPGIGRAVPAIRFDFWNSYADEYGPGDAAALDARGNPKNVNSAWWHKQPLFERRQVTGRLRDCPYYFPRFEAKPPTAYDVLAGMSSGANVDGDFAAFCGEMGLDTDSRKAEAMHGRCVSHAMKLRRFFTSAELEALEAIQ